MKAYYHTSEGQLVFDRAWAGKMHADLKMRPSIPKKVMRSSSIAWVDLNTLQSMALTLQSKLASLSGLAMDMMLSETKTHLPVPPS